MELKLLIVVVALAGVSAVQAKYFKFEDLSKEDSIAQVSQIYIGPDPVLLRDGNYTVDMKLNILQDVPEEAVLKVRYTKIRSVFGVPIEIPIPCLLGKFGSCTLPLCEYMKMFKDQALPFYPEGVEYGCPLKAGEYGAENATVPIPDMSLVARFIVSGKYRTDLKLLDKPRGKELAHYKIWTELK